MKKKYLLATILLLLIAVFAFTFTACEKEVGTLKSLLNEYGIVIDGGGFEEGSTLVSNEIAADTEEGAEVLAAIADKIYDKDGSIYIFDIYVTKDGAKVQPSGKVKVSVPVPNAGVDNYLVFHVKSDNSVENLVPTVADGKISFETSSFSYFIIAEAAPAEHEHNYVWEEGTEPTCEKEGVVAHYHCDGCGKNFDPNYGEVETVSIPKAEHEYGSMYWGKSANFFHDGNIEYYQCAVCEKYFDEQFNEVETVVIPKYSTNISICVNGTPTALVLGEHNDNFIEWSLEGLSVTKGDVITIFQTDNTEFSHDYFADGNIGTDGKILTTAAAANVSLHATDNGLMLFIDGYKYEGIVIEINGAQYPMNYVTYSDEETTGYIYGLVNFAEGDKFVIVDNVNDTVYDYDDLSASFNWNTWDFHRGDNGEFVIDYAARYGIELDGDVTKKIYINKNFAPLDGSAYELIFENTDTEAVQLEQMQIPANSEGYDDLLWYITHEDVVNNEDIVSYIGEKGLYVYIVKLQLEEGMKFNIKNLTANSIINADHLVEVYTENGCITKDGDYINVLVSGYYSIVYMPCYNGIMIEETNKPADVYMYLDGEFVPLMKGEGNVVTYEGLVADTSTNVMFTDNTYTTYLPITLDSQTNASIAHVVESSGMSLLYFDKAGTYNLAYNVETGVLSITSVGSDDSQGGNEGGSIDDYIFFLSVVDYTNGNQTLYFTQNPDNPNELCVRVETMAANSYISVSAMSKSDYSTISYGTLENTDSSIATNLTAETISVKIAGPIEVYFNFETKTIRIVAVS